MENRCKRLRDWFWTGGSSQGVWLSIEWMMMVVCDTSGAIDVRVAVQVYGGLFITGGASIHWATCWKRLELSLM